MHRIGRKWLLACALGFSVAAWGQTPTHPGLVAQDSLNGADTAWMMTSTALVLLMTLPGIALFYGGMVRRKNVLNTMASIVAVAALVSLLWLPWVTPSPSPRAAPGWVTAAACGSAG